MREIRTVVFHYNSARTPYRRYDSSFRSLRVNTRLHPIAPPPACVIYDHPSRERLPLRAAYRRTGNVYNIIFFIYTVRTLQVSNHTVIILCAFFLPLSPPFVSPLDDSTSAPQRPFASSHRALDAIVIPPTVIGYIIL